MSQLVTVYYPPGVTVSVLPYPTTDIILEMTDQASIVAACGASNMAQPWAYSPVFGTESTGLPYLQFGQDPALINPRLISWFLPFTAAVSKTFSYAMWIGPDVQTGLNPLALGVKLPGLDNEVPSGAKELLSLRMEIGPNDPANPGTYPFQGYWYKAGETSGGYGVVYPMGSTRLVANRWYWVKQHIVLNTFTNGVANADGFGEIFLDGVSIWKQTAVIWRRDPTTMISTAHLNFYAGGTAPPLGSETFRFAHVHLSDNDIAMPADMPTYAPPPNWRTGLAKGMVHPIPNTSKLSGATALATDPRTGNNTVDAWGGFSASDTTLYCVANAGHDAGNGNAGSNAVYLDDLSTATAQWGCVNPGSPISEYTAYAPRYLDGTALPRHCYYSPVYLKSLNKTLLMGCMGPYGSGFPTLPDGTKAFNGGMQVDAYDHGTNTWDPPAAWPPMPALLYQTIVYSVCKDPRDETIYVGGVMSLAKFVPSTKTWTMVAPSLHVDTEYRSILVDPKRNLLRCFTAGFCYSFDMATWVETTTHLGLDVSFANYSRVVYDPDNDVYIGSDGTTNTVWSIDPTTIVATAVGTWDVAPFNGPGAHMHYMPAIGGVVYLAGFSRNLQFWPTR